MSSKQTQAQTKSSAMPLPLAQGSMLQRKCACGNHTVAGGECDGCAMKRLQRASKNISNVADVPPIVHEVLRSSGQPLDTTTRAFMEPRFGHDFSHVRLHTDAKAAESARAVNALAYTVGRDVVFGAGQYQTRTTTGRQLLAHELTHVVQQTGRLQRLSIGVEPEVVIGREDDELEREADDAARKMDEDERTPVLRRATAARLQRAPAIVGLDEAGPKAQLAGSEKEDELMECVKKSGPDPNECDPATPLTWANFKGAPSAKSTAGASTSSGYKSVEVPSQACMKKVVGKTTGPTTRFRAYLDSGKSWVIERYKNANDPVKNGCAKFVTDCESFFDKEAAAGLVGGWKAMSTTPGTKCPAGIVARGDKATSKDECATKLGVDCNDQKLAETARLLSHEQGHFDITCVLVKKANASLAAGGNFTKINKALGDKLQPTQNRYDNQSSHGCKAAEQAAWKTDIADGLKKITIP